MAAAAIFVLVAAFASTTGQPPSQPISERPGFCPKSPSADAGTTCTTEADCTFPQKCCRFTTGMLCVDGVIPDYEGTLFVVGLPNTEEAERLLTDAMRTAIGSAASDVFLDIENNGVCAEVYVEVVTDDYTAVDAALANVEMNGISIPSLSSTPFNVSSSDDVCPGPVFNYHAVLYVVGLRYDPNMHEEIIENYVGNLVGSIVSEWDIDIQATGQCAMITFEAVATDTAQLDRVLADLESSPLNITLPVGTVSFTITSIRGPTCEATNTNTVCDGVNDCQDGGNGSDEEECSGACLQSATYCQNNGECDYSEYYGENICMCEHPYSGDQCEIDVCAEMGSNVCGDHGTCIGDLYEDQICECQAGYGGIFCELARRFNQFLLRALQSSADVPAAFLNGKTVLQQLMDLDYHTIEVSKCWDDDLPRSGKYHSVCAYNVSDMASGPDCFCTNGDGLANGWDYVDGNCREDCGEGRTFCSRRKKCISESAVCDGVNDCQDGGNGSDEEECSGEQPTTGRPGMCPRWTFEAEAGIAIYECSTDSDCTDSRTEVCCKVGAGYQCVEAEFDVSRVNISLTIDAPWDAQYPNRNSSQYRQLMAALTSYFGDASVLPNFSGIRIISVRSGSINVTLELAVEGGMTYADIMSLLENLRVATLSLGGASRPVTSAVPVVQGVCAMDEVDCGQGLCLDRARRGAICLCPAGHFGMRCEGTDPCLDSVCMNGGTCESWPNYARTDYEYYCNCPTGFAGSTCEVAVCEKFSRTGPVCGEHGTCVGDLFAESLSDCQRQKRLNEHARAVLQDGATKPGGITADQLQQLLQAMNVDWLPLYQCGVDGSFQLVVDTLSMNDLTTTERMCVSSEGMIESGCETMVCSRLAPFGICQNGGQCVGNIYRQLCDCRGTGYHGAVCTEPGEAVIMSECEERRDLAQITLDVLDQKVDVGGFGPAAAAMLVQGLLNEIGLDTIWKPECEGTGYANVACEYSVTDRTAKECYCVDENQDRRDDVPSNTTGLPDCPEDPCGTHGSCEGDIEDGMLCRCDDGYSGVFCENVETRVHTECERRHQLMTYIMDILQGFRTQPAGFTGNRRQIVMLLGGTDGIVEVPTCQDRSMGYPGNYQSACSYDLNTFQRLRCWCTDEDGDYSAAESCGVDVDKPLQQCNCTAGQKCVSGLRPGLLACTCDPDEDGECQLPRWYCSGMANCSAEEKCVHMKDCDAGKNDDCEIKTRCISMREEHVCDRQPCKHGGSCVAIEDREDDEPGFYCHCPAEYGGKYCERNRSLCRHGCIGDLMAGVLCQCPHGRAGLECRHAANTKCERQHALYTDMMNVWKGDYAVPGYTQKQAQNLIRMVLATVQVAYLPLPNCTADGSYAPVQCEVSMADMSENCYCVNVIGHPLSSNNGGRCVGNLLNGTMCECPVTHTGIFCQDELQAGEQPDKPESLCEFAREVYFLMREMQAGTASAHSESLRGLRRFLFKMASVPDVMIKAECLDDGRYADVQCTYNISTDRPLHCYCMGREGVILSTMTNASGNARPRCDSVPQCPRIPPCNKRCQHGLAHDMHGCQICQCRDPCDGQCGRDPSVRCVVERREECGRQDWDGPCTAGVCRMRKKPGMCPVSVAANLIGLTEMMNGTAASCDVQCLDDADCPGTLKCCGLCGNTCVQPVEDKECQSVREASLQHLHFLRELHQALAGRRINLDTLPSFVRMQLGKLREMYAVWVPTCDADGFFEAIQCMTRVTNSTEMMPDRDDDEERDRRSFDGCFCADRFGRRINGTESDSYEDDMCMEKPGDCPFLQPNATEDHGCEDDFDCQGHLKCCSDGLDATLSASIDEMMMRICSVVPTICGAGGTCVNNWMTEGRICECQDGVQGPLCTQAGTPTQDTTPCQERAAMVAYIKQNANVLSLVEQTIYRVNPDAETIFYQNTMCNEEGDFEPVQCEEDLDGERMACYCVDRDGRRLPGTTDWSGDARKMKCAALNPCDVGTPLHHPNGSLVQCAPGHRECAPGHHCEAGRYGHLFCCRDRSSMVDECHMPAIPGFDCPFYSDNRGQEHVGRCPRIDIPVRDVCPDTCRSDEDCEDEEKCCGSSCGRRCVRALNEEDELCEVGQPMLDMETNQPMTCSASQRCPEGYQCNDGVCCPRRQEQICRQPVMQGLCQAYMPRYFFNSTSRRCERFIYGGCGGNDNNFESMAECCNTCGERGRCKEGVCPATKPVLTTSCKSRCRGDGDCPKNHICCENSCGGSACVLPKSHREEDYTCMKRLQEYHRQMRVRQEGDCFLNFMPRCAEDGSWQEQQCNDKLGNCWCVTPRGKAIPRTRTYGIPQCQFVTDEEKRQADSADMEDDDNEEQCAVCPNGEKVKCCPKELCLQTCPADPTAVCRINPCGGCKAEFFNANNETVNCTAGLSKCQMERMKATRARHQHAIVAVAASQTDVNMMSDMDMGRAVSGDLQVSYTQQGVPAVCHLKPQSGNCRAYVPQWFYNVTSEKCEVFIYGMCGGNENRFNSPEECYSHCNSARNPCAVVRCAGGPCVLSYNTNCFHGPCNVTAACAAAPQGLQMRGVYVPECTREGSFSYRQCQDGYCWCVYADGEYAGGFTDQPGTLQCDENGPVGSFTPPTCPGTSQPNPSCVGKCHGMVCPGSPFARCQVDLCSSDCSVSFVDVRGNTVECADDDQEKVCKARVFNKTEAQCPTKETCSGRSPSVCGGEREDPCENVVCRSNPLVHKSCELKKCEVMAQNEGARENDTLLALPDCDADGSYRPQQKREDNVTVCVDNFGDPVEVLDPAKGCSKD
ncbi:hypothetical protein BaRGS_00006222 [Batillaria attramentaria]|uniref:Uncharacterized protein n=1 Tax=Batillaria attramentaria TaxID=370345 RepID=A0ABD0LUN0_9CAEN